MLPKIEEKKFIGLKITTMGFLCAIFGLLVFTLIAQSIGRIIIYFGFVIGIVGMITHFCIVFRNATNPKD